MASNNLQRLSPADPVYPIQLDSIWGREQSPVLTLLGNSTLLHQPLLAFFCSAKCPGSLIIKAHDFAQELRKQKIPVVSGFHSPVEEEVYAVLQRGTGGLVYCPARSIHRMRLSPEMKSLIEAERLLVVSPFEEKHRRTTRLLAAERNQFVAALSTWLVVAHVSSGGKTERLCADLLGQGKPIYTFESDYNANLFEMGAVSIDKVNLWR